VTDASNRIRGSAYLTTGIVITAPKRAVPEAVTEDPQPILMALNAVIARGYLVDF